MTLQEIKDLVWYRDHFTEQTRRATRAEIKCDELEKQIEFLKRYIKHLEARAYNSEVIAE